MTEHHDPASQASAPSPADDGVDPVAALVVQAQEACADHPELLVLVEQLERLEEVELARRPEVLDAVHRTLREVLTGASRPGRSA
ncbi:MULTISPECIES: hypothetical protein [Aeromicrobium]|uniref:Uncharacterized protein n=1 Tax=Aeromicrobium erythreum TaxID=2041 RepID=A0A0U4CBY9_9ACTN|nr:MULTISPECIES: hypothetical protein [Aeromicrobium]ALX05435.1 hypothetical protein AERYTH_12360 [Aeromicrobium erythreum]